MAPRRGDKGKQRWTVRTGGALAVAGLVCCAGLDRAAAAERKTGVTERVSVDSAGNQANNNSGCCQPPAISADGRFVAFESIADNLVAGDTNGTVDIFVHDRKTGVTERVSVDSAGNQANTGSFEPTLSADGRFVAFHSLADNLVPGDTNGRPDIFVHDRKANGSEPTGADVAEE